MSISIPFSAVTITQNPSNDLESIISQNFPQNSTIGISNSISVIRTNFPVFSFAQDTLGNQQILSFETLQNQAKVILIRYLGLSYNIRDVNVYTIPGMTGSERSIVLEYIRELQRRGLL